MSLGPAQASARIGFTLVVAVAENGVIGRDNTLPWKLKSDLRQFRRLTMGHPVVMGRKTYQSIGRPLDGRTNIVVTTGDFAAPGVIVSATLGSALEVARADALRRNVDAVMVIGGADIFRQMLPMADRIVLTLVHLNPEGDTVFPVEPGPEWREMSRAPYPAAPGDEASFDLVVYERIATLGRAIE